MYSHMPQVQNQIIFILQGINPKKFLQQTKPKVPYITWGKTLLTLLQFSFIYMFFCLVWIVV